MKALLLTLLLCLPLTAQTPCTLSPADLPAIRGLSLAMDRADFEKRYIGAVIVVEKRNAVNKLDFENLEGIWFDFYKDKLSVVEFDYDRTIKWTDVKEFAASLKDTLKIPVESWKQSDVHFEAVVECKGFTAKIDTVQNKLSLIDTVAIKAAKDEAAKLEADKKKAFKP